MNQFPSHPFWDYSLALYARPGVSDACLKLQDEFDLDVNLILFCLWTGSEGPGELTSAELSECRVRGDQWQQEVVQRLRYIRRTLKHDNCGATDELAAKLRPEAQSLELMAEHVEQLFLAGIVPASRGTTGVGEAVANLRAYLELAGIAVGGGAQTEVRTILGQAFPASTAAELDTLWRAK